MKTLGLIQSAISHNLKDPHSKALEPDCLFPPLAIMTQPCWGEGCPPDGRQGLRGDSVDWNGV
jgi:hypothetical protein